MQRIAPGSVDVQSIGDRLAPGLLAAKAPDPVAAMEDERRRVFDEASRRGFEAGQAQAAKLIEARIGAVESEWAEKYAARLQEVADAAAGLRALAEPIEAAIGPLLQDVEAVVIEAVYAAVLRLMAPLAADGTAIVTICRSVLAAYPVRPVVLRVSRNDVAGVAAAFAGADVAVEVDSGLAAGQCRLESGRGQYEDGLEQRLDALKNALLGCQQAPERMP
ncbi:FliH/SctL family protein [Arenimonas terrae]|uniref:Uncharacterized protein n=1 Tax=Arenimonas terrae TaxID=2546226 RepID=A0A5C4RQI7_9GAMM|nr:FliH/SctL family protein [Arenimonas terrae]TNJ33234.1 hypothetical protein E1B00_13120 [Arenimonas terrae]